jgi:hypothetical protein
MIPCGILAGSSFAKSSAIHTEVDSLRAELCALQQTKSAEVIRQLNVAQKDLEAAYQKTASFIINNIR